MILSERLTSKAAMCMGQFEPGHGEEEKKIACVFLNLVPEPNRMSECPWASKQLKAEEVPTFVGGMCRCPEKGGCVGGGVVVVLLGCFRFNLSQGMSNDDYTPRKGPSKEEIAAAGAADGKEKEKKGWFW